MSARGSPLQPRGYDPHPAGSLLLRVREEPGELLTEQNTITHHQLNTEPCLGLLYSTSHFGMGLLMRTCLPLLRIHTCLVNVTGVFFNSFANMT